VDECGGSESQYLLAANFFVLGISQVQRKKCIR